MKRFTPLALAIACMGSLGAPFYFAGGGALSDSEAEAIVAGAMFQGKRCLVAGTCDDTNFNIISLCPSGTGFCTSCRIGEGSPGAAIPINACQTAAGFQCTTGGSTECGNRWLGRCQINDSCADWITYDVACADAVSCS